MSDDWIIIRDDKVEWNERCDSLILILVSNIEAFVVGYIEIMAIVIMYESNEVY